MSHHGDKGSAGCVKRQIICILNQSENHDEIDDSKDGITTYDFAKLLKPLEEPAGVASYIDDFDKLYDVDNHPIGM